MTLALASKTEKLQPHRTAIISLLRTQRVDSSCFSLPFASYAPQLGLLGILSLIVAYGVFTKRGWAPWLIFILFIAATTFSLYTLVVAGFTDALIGLSLLGYLLLTWVFAIYLLLIRRKP